MKTLHIDTKAELSVNLGRERAQGIVEFALMLPLLLVLIFGIIEFGRLLFFYSAVTTATREAARYGSAAEHYNDCPGIKGAARRLGGLVGVQDTNISISYDNGHGVVVSASCPPGGVTLGNRVIVEVKDVQFQPVVPLVNLPPIKFSSKVQRTILIGLALQ